VKDAPNDNGGSAADASSDSAADAPKDTAVDAPKDTAADAPKDTAADVPPDIGGGDADSDAGCYDSVGTPGLCVFGLPVECAWQETYCHSATDSMKAGVAQAASSCMEGLGGCISPNAYDCVRSALNGACFDATAITLCSTVEGLCYALHPISSTACHQLVDGLNALGRQKVQDCIVPPDGGATCQSGLWSCIEGL
jgi:hypothetical protein